MPDQAHVIQPGAGADNAHVDFAIVGSNIRPPAERRNAQYPAISDQHLRCARPYALTIGHDREAHWLVANQPRERSPEIGRATESALGLAVGIADHQRVDANADLKHEILIANLHRIDAGGVRLAPQQRAGSFQIERDAELTREDIRRANRNNAQSDVGADQRLCYIRYRAVAAGRHNHTRGVCQLSTHERHNIFIAGGLINICLDLLTQLPIHRLPNIGGGAAASHWVEHHKNARLFLRCCCHPAAPLESHFRTAQLRYSRTSQYKRQDSFHNPLVTEDQETGYSLSPGLLNLLRAGARAQVAHTRA